MLSFVNKLFVLSFIMLNVLLLSAVLENVFTFVIYEYSEEATVFVAGKTFQSILIFWARPGARPREEHLKGVSLR